MQAHQHSVSVANLIGGTLWLIVFGLILAAWLCMLAGHTNIAVMLAFTACTSSAVSATWTIRTFAQRTQDLIRFTYGFSGPPPPEPRPDLRRVASPQRSRESFTS